VALTEQTALFTIDFTFAHDRFDFYLPFMATRDQDFGSDVASLGYALVDENGATYADGQAVGIVLANAPLTDNNTLYALPTGVATSLTLLVLVTLPEDATAAEYRLQVTDLPFYRNDERTYQRLNPSEIQYYQTPLVTLGTDNG
jgi:hypothetical protein